MEGLIGITVPNLRRLMRIKNNRVDKEYRKKYVILSLMAVRNSFFHYKEKRLFESQIHSAELPGLVFVLGHWRSGTTFLHNLLSLHPYYAYPNQFQVSKPFTFLHREKVVEKVFSEKESRKRAMDNVEVNFHTPGEDESALAVGSIRSPYIGWTFPKNHLFYERFLSMQDVSKEEMQEWQEFFVYFLRKLSLRYNGAPLIMKSPTHTARIPILLRMFPTAKFIHLHRNPYIVYQSTEKFYREALPGYHLQRPGNNETNHEIIVRLYKNMYRSYFDHYQEIPDNQFIEISYDELVMNPFETIQKISEKIDLGKSEEFDRSLQEYILKNKNYKKNKYPEIDLKLKRTIYEQFRESFERWNYPQ
jgi:hypothetical protein